MTRLTVTMGALLLAMAASARAQKRSRRPTAQITPPPVRPVTRQRRGLANQFPLAGSSGSPAYNRLILTILHGITGEIEVEGEIFTA
jgi:hypothetical protein